MLSENLILIKDELDRYKNVSRNELFTKCIDEKLKGTLKKYNEETNLTSTYLIEQSSIRVMKTLTKIQKKNDIEVLEAYSKGEEADD